MTYLELVRGLTFCLSVIMGLLTVHFFVFAFIGIFRKKKYPEVARNNRFGIIIPARNEENVISDLIDSIHRNDYPQELLQIFVIAHNCSDHTAEIARNHGATVYEYNNSEENTMGYAFRKLFSLIERDYGTQSFDGFIIFNADNILAKNYISRMNDAFEYYKRQSVITSYRNSKNFGSNLISGLYGMYFTVGCCFESRGRTVTGCSTRVQGTGYLFNSDIVKNGWPYVSLTEDWEFTADQILAGNNLRYCDEAVFYDEQPTSFRIMWRQRVRWSRGHLLIFYARFKEIVACLFRKKTRSRFSLYDLSVNIMPFPLMMLAVQIIKTLLLIIAPAIDGNVSFHDIILGDSSLVFFSNGLVYDWLRAIIGSYILTAVCSAFVFVLERTRIRGVGFLNKILITLLWPVFIMIQIPIDIQALFSRNIGWKPIPHGDFGPSSWVKDSTDL